MPARNYIELTMTIKSEIKSCSLTTLHSNIKFHFKGPFVITQCYTNVMVNLKCGAIQIKHNIRCIQSYKLDTKVEDFNSINMDDAVNI